MNNSSILSATVGSIFFGASYWVLPATFLGLPAFIPSFAIGVLAYGATQMVFSKKEQETNVVESLGVVGALSQAKKTNTEIFIKHFSHIICQLL